MADGNEILLEIAKRLRGTGYGGTVPRLAQRTGAPLPTAPDGGDLSLMRPDGTNKGRGFFGPLPLPHGGVATEYSVADSEQLHGRDYPSIVPTLTLPELVAVLAAADDQTGRTTIPESVYGKAEAYAVDRDRRGLSPFAQAGEEDRRFQPVPSHVSLADFVSGLLRRK